MVVQFVGGYVVCESSLFESTDFDGSFEMGKADCTLRRGHARGLRLFDLIVYASPVHSTKYTHLTTTSPNSYNKYRKLVSHIDMF